MSAAFTRGPWHFDGYPEGQVYEVSTGGEDDRIVCLCEFELDGDDRTWPRMAESRANARLIATAPELYARGESAALTLTEMAKILRGVGRSGCADICDGEAARITATLAKARDDA